MEKFLRICPQCQGDFDWRDGYPDLFEYRKGMPLENVPEPGYELPDGERLCSPECQTAWLEKYHYRDERTSIPGEQAIQVVEVVASMQPGERVVLGFVQYVDTGPLEDPNRQME